MSSFLIRPASIGRADHELFLDMWESQIQQNQARGSADQWGTTPIRKARTEVIDDIRAFIERGEAATPWGPEWCRAYVAEKVPSDETTNDSIDDAVRDDATPAASMILTARSAEYTRDICPKQDENGGFVYLHFLMSDARVGALAKGGGSALISHAKKVVADLGITRICLDCWTGNERKLVKYYERQGFQLLQDFVIGPPRNWPGSLLEMRL